jgi:hypothetical protein
VATNLNAQLAIASKVKMDLATVNFDDAAIKDYFVSKYAPGATDLELIEFISTAIADEAIPGEDIYFMKFKKSDGGGYYPATIVHSINWMTRKANESGDFVGFTDPEYLDSSGQWVKVWASKNTAPVACKIGVIKKHTDLIGYSTVRWDERYKNQGEWKNQPIHMLTKCAKAQALRDAGFKGVKGRYAYEEMYKDMPDGVWVKDPNKSETQNAIDRGNSRAEKNQDRRQVESGDISGKPTPEQTAEYNALKADVPLDEIKKKMHKLWGHANIKLATSAMLETLLIELRGSTVEDPALQGNDVDLEEDETFMKS